MEKKLYKKKKAANLIATQHIQILHQTLGLQGNNQQHQLYKMDIYFCFQLFFRIYKFILSRSI